MQNTNLWFGTYKKGEFIKNDDTDEEILKNKFFKLLMDKLSFRAFKGFFLFTENGQKNGRLYSSCRLLLTNEIG